MKISSQSKLWLYLSTGTLFSSGVIWAVWHYLLSPAGSSPFESVISPVEPWSLKIHGAAAFIFLIVFGVLIPSHINTSIRANRNKRSGFLMIAVSGILVVSGYGLYYCGIEGARDFISVSHLVIGILLPVFLLIHMMLGRRSKTLKK